MSLSREQILGASDLKTKDVPVPEWGGSVLIRQLSAEENTQWADQANADKDITAQRRGLVSITVMVSMSVVDDSGKRLFTADDVAALQGKNPNALRRIFDACLAFNGATDGEVKAIEKN